MKLLMIGLLLLSLTSTSEGISSEIDGPSECRVTKDNLEHIPAASVDDTGNESKYSSAVTSNTCCVRSRADGTTFIPGNESSVQTYERRRSYTCAQALELLVSKWNDLGSWPRRNDTSSVCEQDVETSISNFLSNEVWALNLFDSWAKPGPSLMRGRSAYVGDYSQCRETISPASSKGSGFKGSYCVITLVNLMPADVKTVFLTASFKLVNLGTCLPDTCSKENASKLFQDRIESMNLSSLLLAAAVDCRSDNKEYTPFTRLAIALVAVFGTITVLGTALDIGSIYWPRWTTRTDNQQTDNGNEMKGSKTVDANKGTPLSKEPRSTVSRFVLSFSAWSNGQRLLSTYQPPDSISAISGIRFLTMTWILFGHILYMMGNLYGDNGHEGFTNLLTSRANDVVINFANGVDTFFVISGVLVSYQWVKAVMENGWTFNWRYFVCHRYWRLTSPYIITFILIQGLQGLFVSGAVASSLQPLDRHNCEGKWWHHPLYINNLFISSMEEMCYIQSWSLACDMHFYLLSPLMLISFYYHKYAGVACCLLFATAQWIYVGVMAYSRGWLLSCSSAEDPGWLHYYYFPSYARIAPFVLGIIAGYFLAVNGGRIKMRRREVIVGWVLALALVLALIFGSHSYITGEQTIGLFASAIAIALSKGIWSVAVLWIIVACASGYGGPINAILSWSPFTVLGRLTYMCYLTQIFAAAILFENLERAVYLNTTSLMVYGTANLCLTCVISAVLTVCVEYPMLNLEKVFFGTAKH